MIMKTMQSQSILPAAILTLWMGATAFAAGDQNTPDSTAQEKTVIVSDHLEMRSTEEKNYFYFRENVRVEATNLVVESNLLEVVALREGQADDLDATVGEIGAIDSIIATGNVAIYQAGREAHAGRAEVLPRAGRVILSDSPRVLDGDTEVTGWQIVLNKGDRQVTVVPNPDAKAENNQRPTITLGGSALPDLGFDENEESETSPVEEGETTQPDP